MEDIKDLNITNWLGLINSKYHGKYLISSRIDNIPRKLLRHIPFSVMK